MICFKTWCKQCISLVLVHFFLLVLSDASCMFIFMSAEQGIKGIQTDDGDLGFIPGDKCKVSASTCYAYKHCFGSKVDSCLDPAVYCLFYFIPRNRIEVTFRHNFKHSWQALPAVCLSQKDCTNGTILSMLVSVCYWGWSNRGGPLILRLRKLTNSFCHASCVSCYWYVCC